MSSPAPFNVRVLHRSDSKGFPDDLDLNAPRYGFGVSWDSLGDRRVDIDLQCVVVDTKGVIIDCAYYNNMKAARAITHSGDEAFGKPNHIDEMVWANLNRLSADVGVLLFVVAAYSGGSLRDVSNGKLHVLEERETKEIALFEMESSEGSVDVVAGMFRSRDGGWKLRIIDVPAERGQHFMDILPTLSTVIRTFIPIAPQRQKVAFAMEKGSVLDLPQDLGQVTVGLGWDVDDGEVDLDVSAVLLDGSGNDIETVFFGRLESVEHGIRHTGDNLTGEGEGDDEQIAVDLGRIGAEVQQVVFVVNVYTPRRTFAQVANPYCRVLDNSSGAELCRYALRDAGSQTGLIIARISREAGNRWGFHALGLPCRGSMYKDSLPQIRALSGVKTSSLLARSHSNETFGTGTASTAATWSEVRAPRAPAGVPVKRPSLVQRALRVLACGSLASVRPRYAPGADTDSE